MTKIKLDQAGVRKYILQADYMQQYVEHEADKRCGSDSHVKSFVGFDRVHSIIYPNRKEDSK